MNLLAPLLLVLSASAPVTDAPIRTEHFSIVATPRARQAANTLAGELEPLRADVVALLGRDWPGTTELRIGFGRTEYEALALPGGAPPSWAVALAYPAHNVMLIEADSLDTPEGMATLRHELVHVALGRLAPSWPHWFQEGLAQHLARESSFTLDRYAVLSRAVSTDRIFDFDDLAQGFPSQPEDVEVAYAQSVAFVEFLRARHGDAGFQKLFDVRAEGEPFETAFAIAFGISLPMEVRHFEEELPRRYPWWPMLLSGGTLAWALTALLLPLAFVRRRVEVRELRAKQLRFEIQEEAANLMVSTLAANDDCEPALESELNGDAPERSVLPKID